MTDAMQIAQQRRQSYLTAIARKESEIAEMNELIADLDSFIEFGEALVGNQPADTAGEPARPAAVETPHEDDDEEENWDTAEPQQHIARVISQRVG